MRFLGWALKMDTKTNETKTIDASLRMLGPTKVERMLSPTAYLCWAGIARVGGQPKPPAHRPPPTATSDSATIGDNGLHISSLTQARRRLFSMIPPRNFPPRRPRIRENVNEAIRVREVRAVFPDGSVEIMPTLAAVRKAQDMGLDLIL